MIPETKTCSKCQQNKQATEFTISPRNKDGLRAHCKGCHRQYYYRDRSRWQNTVPVDEKICHKCGQKKTQVHFHKNKNNHTGLAHSCKECYKAYWKSYYAKNKNTLNRRGKLHRQRYPEQHATYERKKRYGLTEQEYTALLDQQEHRCKICLCIFDNNIHVDHCHSTKKVRGLLCSTCNTGLGMLKENIDHLQRAILYLQET